MIALYFYQKIRAFLEYNMADFQQNSQTNFNLNNQHQAKPNAQGFSQTALNIILMVIETILTLLLRFDAPLRQIMYPLAQDNITLCIKSYVPHLTIYATFNVNGVLLDSQLPPHQKVDVTINGFTWEIVQAIFSQKVNAVEKLQFRGEVEKVAQVKAFFLAIGVVKSVQEIIQKFTGKSQKTQEKPKKSIQEYQQKIEEQKQQISELTIKNAEVETALLELKSQNKILKISLGIAIILFLISFIFIFAK